jgi:hypothetical protein
MPNDIQNQIDRLRRDLDELTQEFYLNNFSDSKDYNKYSRFNFRLKVPSYASNPTIGSVGDIVEVGGKLKICTTASLTAPTWTIVGTQT